VGNYLKKLTSESNEKRQIASAGADKMEKEENT
jgi:hypothetical protein